MENGLKPDVVRNILRVHIVDGMNLIEGKQYKVRVEHDRMAEESSFKYGPGPIWNEAIVF